MAVSVLSFPFRYCDSGSADCATRASSVPVPDYYCAVVQPFAAHST